MRRAFELSLDRDAINQVVFNGEFVPGNQWVNPQSPFYQQAFPIPKRDVAKAKALLKEAGVATPITVDFMVTNATRARRRRRGHAGDGRRGGLRPEDSRHRGRDARRSSARTATSSST